jgi:hypothetical protein
MPTCLKCVGVSPVTFRNWLEIYEQLLRFFNPVLYKEILYGAALNFGKQAAEVRVLIIERCRKVYREVGAAFGLRDFVARLTDDQLFYFLDQAAHVAIYEAETDMLQLLPEICLLVFGERGCQMDLAKEHFVIGNA